MLLAVRSRRDDKRECDDFSAIGTEFCGAAIGQCDFKIRRRPRRGEAVSSEAERGEHAKGIGSAGHHFSKIPNQGRVLIA